MFPYHASFIATITSNMMETHRPTDRHCRDWRVKYDRILEDAITAKQPGSSPCVKKKRIEMMIQVTENEEPRLITFRIGKQLKYWLNLRQQHKPPVQIGFCIDTGYASLIDWCDD